MTTAALLLIGGIFGAILTVIVFRIVWIEGKEICRTEKKHHAKYIYDALRGKKVR